MEKIKYSDVHGEIRLGDKFKNNCDNTIWTVINFVSCGVIELSQPGILAYTPVSLQWIDEEMVRESSCNDNSKQCNKFSIDEVNHTVSNLEIRKGCLVTDYDIILKKFRDEVYKAASKYKIPFKMTYGKYNYECSFEINAITKDDIISGEIFYEIKGPTRFITLNLCDDGCSVCGVLHDTTDDSYKNVLYNIDNLTNCYTKTKMEI